MSSPNVQRCRQCGRAMFPARYRCFRCASAELVLEAVDHGTVLAFTRVHRVPPSCSYGWLLEVHAADGVRIIAAAQSQPECGQRVLLHEQPDGAIVAVPTDVRKEENHG